VNRTNHDRYDGYQSKTARPIPLVVIRRHELRAADAVGSGS